MNSKYSSDELEEMSPKKFRSIARRGDYTEPDMKVCRGYAMANVAIVPKDYAFEFLLFCNRNPRPCPVLEVTELGDPHPKLMAPDADLRTDLPRYRVFQDGKVIDEPTDVTKYWRDDLVAFLIGCSASFDWSLRTANVQFRYTGDYTSNIRCVPAGRFHGPMVISCRLVKNSHDAVRAVQISSRHLLMHGPPIHVGDPAIVGIKDLYHADQWPVNDVAPQQLDEVAMFWGCGVTPQTVALESKISFMITHYPSHMFITDFLTEELASL